MPLFGQKKSNKHNFFNFSSKFEETYDFSTIDVYLKSNSLVGKYKHPYNGVYGNWPLEIYIPSVAASNQFPLESIQNEILNKFPSLTKEEINSRHDIESSIEYGFSFDNSKPAFIFRQDYFHKNDTEPFAQLIVCDPEIAEFLQHYFVDYANKVNESNTAPEIGKKEEIPNTRSRYTANERKEVFNQFKEKYLENKKTHEEPSELPNQGNHEFEKG